jgi:hypothetical protein
MLRIWMERKWIVNLIPKEQAKLLTVVSKGRKATVVPPAPTPNGSASWAKQVYSH